MEELIEIMRRLRDPDNGCPWDVEQDFASIAPYTIEEAYEVADAIQRESWADLKDELGDLLLQVVFHSQMANEAGLFDINDVAASINDKLVRRHPNVFGDMDIESAEEQVLAWEASKTRERKDQGMTSLMDGVPAGMNEFIRATKLQKRAAQAGFDWPSAGPVLEKHQEELAEVTEAIASGDKERMQDEVGDLLFVTVNLARKLKLDPGEALRHANAKFEGRFRAMESAAGDCDALSGMELDEMEELWQAIKKTGAGNT